MTTRPQLPTPTLEVYIEGERRLAATRGSDGLASWMDAASRLSKSGRASDAVWLMSRIATAASRAGNWPGAQEAWETAIRQATGSDWWIRVRLHDAYAAEAAADLVLQRANLLRLLPGVLGINSVHV